MSNCIKCAGSGVNITPYPDFNFEHEFKSNWKCETCNGTGKGADSMIKKVTLRLEDINGEIQAEKIITVSDNDLLIMKYPDDMPFKEVRKIFDGVSMALDYGPSAIAIPDCITFEVIRKSSDGQ